MRTSLVRLVASYARTPGLVLYTGGPECSLCSEAHELLLSLKDSQPDLPHFTLELVNIRDPKTRYDWDVKKWRRLYQYDIPVLHINGRQTMKHRLDEGKLVELIKAAAASDQQQAGKEQQ